MTRAIFYDGVTADRHEVELGSTDDALRLTTAAESFEIPWTELGVGDEDRQLLVLNRTGCPGWRLILDQPVDPNLRARLPAAGRYGSWVDRVGLFRASALFAGVAAAVLLVGYSAPAWLAPLVPESWERNLGTAIVGDFGDNACRDPAASQALARLAARLDPGRPGSAAAPMTLIDFDIFNAAALPGGQIVIFDGALRETDNPDAMAGILAHEIAHVRRRHVTQALIRELGIGALIRLFAGDIGANASQLVSLSYTRSNEYEADGDAIAALNHAGIDPRPTGGLFRKLGQEEGRAFAATEFLDSHPNSGDRGKRFEAGYRQGARYSPSLSAAEYRAIRTACPAKRDAERDREKADKAE
ncbi:MAG TPA: M48 family metallopeptidase [Sphingomicrobium sp.]